MFSIPRRITRRFSRSSFGQNFGKAGGCIRSRRMARMVPTRTEDRALQRCNLSAVPGAKTEGGRSLTAHLPCDSIKQPSDLASCEKTFVAGCHDCDLTGCPHAQHIRVWRAAKPQLLASGVRAKPALSTNVSATGEYFRWFADSSRRGSTARAMVTANSDIIATETQVLLEHHDVRHSDSDN